ncbi:MAG: hypothetical protein H6595_08815 [Flavobacteriales bacterium]|nr:hypothetical protein [Flavobacteriales bacterium]MCB9167568.1 hypothetical protein [Flavobacteriales bacterium]
MKRGLLAGCALFAAFHVSAQEDDRGVPRDLIEQRIEAAAENLGDDSDVDLTTLFDVLTDRYTDPIDLNHTSAEELNTLGLLTDVQIGALFDHIHRDGPLLSIYELQTINAWDARTIELVRPFVTVREREQGARAGFKEILRNLTQEVTIRSQVNVEERRGFQDRTNLFGREYADPDGDPLADAGDPAVRDSLRANNKVYLGSPYKLYLRYRARYRNNLSFGFTAEKDEGEEFFRGSQPNGFDFYSAHLFIRDLGRVKAIALGDYQAQFGLGLTYWSGLAFSSKSSYSLNIKRNASGLLPYTSVNENLFNRGAGITVEPVRHVEVTAFWSRNTLDANSVAVSDTAGAETPEITFSSFQEDGFHRTNNELAKKDALVAQTFGGHIAYRRTHFQIGVTGAHVGFDATLNKDVKPYNQFEFQGDGNTTLGADFTYLYRNASFFGEVARSDNGGIGLNVGTLIALDRRVSLALLYRDYQRDFHGLYSVGFAEGSNPWNERGLYTGLEIRASRAWVFNCYFDQFTFPWLRYQVDAPTSGYEALGQLNWSPSKKVSLYVRMRHEDKGYNTELPEQGIDAIVRRVQNNYRFNASYKVSDAIGLRTRVEVVDFKRGDAPLDHGFLIYQDLVHRPLHSIWEITLRAALFNTTSYDARVYAYENDLIGVFSIPPYYGRGMRWYAMLRLTPLRRVDLWLRYGAWIYNGQDRISSGLQEISGPMKSDVKVQVRVRF